MSFVLVGSWFQPVKIISNLNSVIQPISNPVALGVISKCVELDTYIFIWVTERNITWPGLSHRLKDFLLQRHKFQHHTTLATVSCQLWILQAEPSCGPHCSITSTRIIRQMASGPFERKERKKKLMRGRGEERERKKERERILKHNASVHQNVL